MSLERRLHHPGYVSRPLTWDGTVLTWGDKYIPMVESGLEEPPGNVKEVLLLKPQEEKDGWLDGALITLSPHTTTRVQRFSGTRTFIEQPVCGRGVWVGITPDGTSITYTPGSTYSFRTRALEGSLMYGPGWVQCWINMSHDDFQYVELCLPAFTSDNTIEVLNDNAPVAAPMFWGVLHALLARAAR